MRFRPGDRIRLALAAADPGSFRLMPANGRATYWIGHGPAGRSFLELRMVRP